MANKPLDRGAIDSLFGKPANQLDSKPANRQTVKATFYLTNESIILLEKIKLDMLQKGEKVTKSELINRAVLLLNQQTSLTA